jgi:diaminopimelate epimerase
MPLPRLGHDAFAKSHALGNDYLVMDPKMLSRPLTPERIRLLCHRNLGLGSDGILTLEQGKDADFGLRIFNPDGSEAEKSGNGLRIFCRFLHDHGYTAKTEFTVSTLGGRVSAKLEISGGEVRLITVDMGRAEVGASDETAEVSGRKVRFIRVSVGNPHCVLIDPALGREDLLTLGPLLETHPIFPNRSNVQFVTVEDRHRIRLLIWERGAGETLASGSSACAAAAACLARSLVDSPVKAIMPGGELGIEILPDGMIRMAGPTTPVCTGRLLL